MRKTYQNGNVTVTINTKNGWKERFTEDDDFRPEFAECCDIHISDKCDNECPYCYAGCGRSGSHGRLLGWKFMGDLHPWTEMAINIQNPPPLELPEFLHRMKRKHVIVNATVNQNHFMRDDFYRLIKSFQSAGLLHGIGISMTDPTDAFIARVKETPNSIIHVINGIITVDELEKLSHKNLNVLILGYKTLGRGFDYFSTETISNAGSLYSHLGEIIQEGWFSHLCFDNLALKQLHPRRFLSDEDWDLSYQGDDGTSTFFINLVDGTFGKNSLTSKKERFPIGNKSIDEMFKVIQIMNK